VAFKKAFLFNLRPYQGSQLWVNRPLWRAGSGLSLVPPAGLPLFPAGVRPLIGHDEVAPLLSLQRGGQLVQPQRVLTLERGRAYKSKFSTVTKIQRAAFINTVCRLHKYGVAASIGTEVTVLLPPAGQGYLEVGLGYHSIIPLWAVDLFPALLSCRMWTVFMINFLRYASYHADTDLLEPLMSWVHIRAQWGEHG
jgi:hypothetical protein